MANTVLTYTELEVPSGSTILQYTDLSVPATGTLSPSLEWNINQLNELSPSLAWEINGFNKFNPNIINSLFDFPLPSIGSSNYKISFSGCLAGISFYMKNTGSSGQTVIKIFINGVLQHTETIVADDDEYSTYDYSIVDTLLSPSDEISVEINEVAVDAEILKVNVYTMTFPFELEVSNIGNIQDDVVFSGLNGEYLFSSADYWYIELNQPVLTLDYLKVIDRNGQEVPLSGTLEKGNFYNSRVKFAPYDYGSVDHFRVCVQDVFNVFQVFNVKAVTTPYMSDFPEYSTTSLEIDSWVGAKYYKYSLDNGVTWTSWDEIDDTQKISLDFTGQSTGLKQVKVQYKLGNSLVEDFVEIYYATGSLDASVLFDGEQVKILYEDNVPFAGVEVYYDDELVKTVMPTIYTGFASVSVNNALGTITVAAGSIYYNHNKYNWDGTAYVVQPVINNHKTMFRVLFGFVPSNGTFVFKEFENKYPGDDFLESIDDFIPLWLTEYVIVTRDSSFSSYDIYFMGSSRSQVPTASIPLELAKDREIKVIVYDIVGRYISSIQSTIKTKFNIWRELTVSDTSTGQVIFPGEIHQFTQLDFNIESDDWESPI